MIIPLGKDRSYRDAYLLCVEPVDKSELLRRAKALPDTYAGDLVARLHDGIFQCSLDLRADYEKYYAVEYRTFAEYLQRRVRLSPEIIRRVMRRCSKSKKVIHFHPAYSFLENDYGDAFLKKLLEP